MARVMVVDDDEGIRRLVAKIVQSDGHAVCEEPDGATALRHFAGDPVDLVISDIYMPDMDGIEFLMRVRATHPEARIIMMSGGGALAADNVLRASQALGATVVLRKPFSAIQMRAAVQLALKDAGT
jgi:DNA-binding NtrC family response regulator